MEIFRDLQFRGESERIEAAVEAIRQCLSDGWTRNAEAEVRLKETAIGREAYHAFSCPEVDCHPAATVFLLHSEPNFAHVPNVVPSAMGQLSHREYNAILEEFFERFRGLRGAERRQGGTDAGRSRPRTLDVAAGRRKTPPLLALGE